jgi:hypothetical protein
LNATFLAMAIAAGRPAQSPTAGETTKTVLAADVFMARDELHELAEVYAWPSGRGGRQLPQLRRQAWGRRRLQGLIAGAGGSG